MTGEIHDPMPPLVKAALREALFKAFSKEYFDRSGIDQAAKVLSRPLYPDTLDSAMMSALHCVAWVRLTQEEKMELGKAVARHLGVEAVETVCALIPSTPSSTEVACVGSR